MDDVAEAQVRRCINEVQKAIKSGSPLVQYHTLVLRHTLCKNDRSSISQLLSGYISDDSQLDSPLAVCLLLRMLASYIENSPADDDTSKFINYLRQCLNHTAEEVQFDAARLMIATRKHITKSDESQAIARLRGFLASPRASLRFASLRLLNELQANDLDTRSWNIHRIGNLCRLHLLTKRYKPGDEIIGVIDFINSSSSVACVKYSCVLQCEELDQFELKQEFSLGYKQSDFSITIPHPKHPTPDILVPSPSLSSQVSQTSQGLTFHYVLSFLFYIATRDHPRSLYEDKAGTIEQAPSEIETKLFSCDFPILVHVV